MGAARARMVLVLVLSVSLLAWGTSTCLYHLNHFLAPPRPIRAVEFHRLDDERLVCTLLGVNLVLEVPHRHSWWVPGAPPPGPQY
ncbi:MAG: hypothetical protein AB1402_02510 [Bacillota bacterium]